MPCNTAIHRRSWPAAKANSSMEPSTGRAPYGGYPSARRSPSGRASWRMPDTYHTAGLRRGPPLQVLRRPGQPPSVSSTTGHCSRQIHASRACGVSGSMPASPNVARTPSVHRQWIRHSKANGDIHWVGYCTSLFRAISASGARYLANTRSAPKSSSSSVCEPLAGDEASRSPLTPPCHKAGCHGPAHKPAVRSFPSEAPIEMER
jgi:hypothetical protein